MSDPQDPHGDQRIEELLSQLQGIFSKLSTSEQAESEQKVAPTPGVPQAPAPAPETPPASIIPEIPTPTSPSPEAPLIEHLSDPEPTPPVSPSAPPPEPSPVAPPPVIATEPAVPDDDTTIRVAICYPEGSENEVKILAQKLETLSPKFTKVAFKLAVRLATPYKLKTTDWSEDFFQQAHQDKIRAYFFVMQRPLEDAKRKALATTLEKFGIYFQEVPLIAIEKKAFYMDLLLGLVFFFDTHGISPKPPADPAS